jgi:hypothetical protein
MSTPNIPDEELDDFFRKSLGDPELDFREEDWLKMEQKLKDNRARERATYRRFLYSLLGLLLVIAPVLTWYFVAPSTPTAVPTIAVQENKNTENTAGTAAIENGNIPTSNGENVVGSTTPPASEQSGIEKEVTEIAEENKPEMISSSGDKTEPAVTQDVSKLKNVPKQNGSLSKETSEQANPSTRQQIGSPNKLDNKEKETSLGKIIPSTPDLSSGKTGPKQTNADEEINPDRKKVNKDKNINEQLLTQDKQDKLIGKQPSDFVANDTENRKQFQDYKKGKNSDGHPVSERSGTDKNIGEQALNNTNSEPIVILPGQNRQEVHAINKEAFTSTEISIPAQEQNIVQPNHIYSIEAIPTITTRPLTYEIQLTNLLNQPTNLVK